VKSRLEDGADQVRRHRVVPKAAVGADGSARLRDPGPDTFDSKNDHDAADLVRCDTVVRCDLFGDIAGDGPRDRGFTSLGRSRVLSLEASIREELNDGSLKG